MCSTYGRFLPKLKAVAEPLNQLPIKGILAQLSVSMERIKRSFHLLEAGITDPPILRLLDEKKTLFKPEIDTSAYQINY